MYILKYRLKIYSIKIWGYSSVEGLSSLFEDLGSGQQKTAHTKKGVL